MAERVIDWHAGNQLYNKEAVDALLAKKQDAYGDGKNPIDDRLDRESENVVQNKVVAEALDELRHDLEHVMVPVGTTLFWPKSEAESRKLESDSEVRFEFDGRDFVVVPDRDAEAKLCVASGAPDLWAPCDGTATLLCSDYPALAEYFGGTQNDDGTWNCDGNNVADDWKDGKSSSARVWIPYCPQTIIKIA